MFGQILGVLWRVMLVIMSCYLAISVLIFFLKPRKLSFDTADSIPNKIVRNSLRPVTDLAFDKRLSLDFDWKAFKYNDYRKNEAAQELVKVNNTAENNFNNFKDLSWYNLNNTSQSIILQPENLAQNKTWFLVRCLEQDNLLYCQKNNIALLGTIKTSIFKSEQAYLGVDSDGNFIKLKSVQTINTDQRKDLVFI